MDQMAEWHRTKLGRGVFAIVELALAYGFASLAIDRGSPIWYLLTLIALVGCLQNFVKLIGIVIHDIKATKA